MVESHLRSTIYHSPFTIYHLHMFKNKQFRRSEGHSNRRNQKLQDERRGTSSSRGYGQRWRKYRTVFLAENPFCIFCGTEMATMIDHIIPVEQGDGPLCGESDPLFWAPWNHQPLSNHSHIIKSHQHDARLRINRMAIITRLTTDEDDTNARRNELLTMANIWPHWIDLETGQKITSGG